MAKQPDDTKTGDLVPTVDDKEWLRMGMDLLYKSYERQRAKYPPGTGAYRAVSEDMDKIQAVKEKIR